VTTPVGARQMQDGSIVLRGGAMCLRSCLYLLLALEEASWFIANELQLLAKCLLRPASLIRRCVGVALIFAVLLCGALASSSALHRLIHPDADNDHHECAITVFAHGNVNVTGGSPEVMAPIFIALPGDDSFQNVVLVSCDYLLLPGRAPPVLSA
jgi:hypothetical protein